MTMTDKESVAQLLKETIVQLCKANIFYSGQVEIDGIICISGQVEGQELVIKVHEIFATPQDLRNPYAAITCQPLAAKFSDFQNLYGNYHRQELKRRRLENSFDFRPSFAYSYLSKLVYGQNHPNTFTQPGLDQRNGATDLSIKSSLAVSNHWSDLHSDGSLSPYQGVETKYNVRDERLQTPVRSLLGGKTALQADGCVPGKSLLPQCRVCFCSFESPESLSEHNEVAHSVFTCLCCFKTFTSRSNLERHSRLHTGHRPFACDVCGKSFSRKDHLSNHATKHAFKCGACSHRCADRAALVAHCLHEHGAAVTNVCAFCNKGFCGADPYEEHLKSHPQWNPDDDAKMNPESAGSQVAARPASKDRYSCVSCDFETNDKVSVAKHQLVHSNERRLYTCRGCGKIYEDPLQYSDHLILHQKERDIFECCICRQVCGTLSSLRRHEAAHVSDDNSDMETVAEDGCFRCGKCSRTFETHQFLQEHLEVHELAKQRQSCHSYQKPLEDPIDLNSHPGAKEGQGHVVAPEETNNCLEDCSGTADVASRRDKRKQKQPKPAVNMISEMVGGGESDIEVAEPRTPGVREDEKNCNFVITDNPACVIQVSADVEIKMETPKSILNRSTTPVVSVKPRNDPAEPEDGGLLCSLPAKLEVPEETIERARSNVGNRVRLSTKHRGRGKGRHRETRTGRSSHLAGLLENHVSLGASPSIDMVLNNNSTSVRNENHPLGGDVPSGSFVCVVCSFEADTFQALDGHSVTLHSRSPCMFCAKTFAQKANRDRHHCLHTGDKPYGCPECSEKFSRGDKLKMHRVRAHGIQYPLYGSRHKETSSRDREFASSPGFLSLQSDGFSPMASAGYLPALPAFEGHEPDDDAVLRTSGVDDEDVNDIGRHVSEFSRINSDLAKNWKNEKKGNVHWVKTQPKETEVNEENNILEDVAPIN